jgi:hypothetical protein
MYHKKLRCKLGLHKYHKLYWTKTLNYAGDKIHYCAYCDAFSFEESGNEWINPTIGFFICILILCWFIGFGTLIYYLIK